MSLLGRFLGIDATKLRPGERADIQEGEDGRGWIVFANTDPHAPPQRIIKTGFTIEQEAQRFADCANAGIPYSYPNGPV